MPIFSAMYVSAKIMAAWPVHVSDRPCGIDFSARRRNLSSSPVSRRLRHRVKAQRDNEDDKIGEKITLEPIPLIISLF